MEKRIRKEDLKKGKKYGNNAGAVSAKKLRKLFVHLVKNNIILQKCKQKIISGICCKSRKRFLQQTGKIQESYRFRQNNLCAVSSGH